MADYGLNDLRLPPDAQFISGRSSGKVESLISGMRQSNPRSIHLGGPHCTVCASYRLELEEIDLILLRLDAAKKQLELDVREHDAERL